MLVQTFDRSSIGMGSLPESVSQKGDCSDNAVAESVFQTLKSEHVHQPS